MLNLKRGFPFTVHRSNLKKTLLVFAVFFALICISCTRAQQYDDASDFRSGPLDGGKSVEITAYVGTKQTVSIPPRIEGMFVTAIGNAAFQGKEIIKVTIPTSVTSIGERAFSGCSSLASVSIPSRVTSIGERAFEDCSSLTSITVATNNPNYASEGGILYNKTKTILIKAPQGISGSVTIPNSVTSIGEGAFSRCANLTGITIPNRVTSIGRGAFYGCTSLASVSIGNSVASIEGMAFSGCTSLASITIPDSVTSIGDLAFSGCTSLASITIPNSVTSIGQNTFNNCESLASVTIGNSVTSIGQNAFNNCKSLASVSIGNSVTSIGPYAFSKCDSLASITIPASVTSIGSYAFDGCTSLASVTFMGTVSIGISAFHGNLARVYTGPGTYTTANPGGQPVGLAGFIAGAYTAENPSGWNAVWRKQSVSSSNTQASENTETVTHPDNAKRVVTLDTTRLKYSQDLGKYETLRLRSEPSTRGTIVAELSRGDEVTILETGAAYTDSDGISGNWVRVRYGNIVGWCFSGYLDIP